MSVARCTIDVDGVAPGVGFRPLVHGLARFGLAGFVRSQLAGLHSSSLARGTARFEIEGDGDVSVSHGSVR